MPADYASEIVKFTISIPRESCTNAKAKYSSSVVPPDPSVHFYHCALDSLECTPQAPATDQQSRRQSGWLVDYRFRPSARKSSHKHKQHTRLLIKCRHFAAISVFNTAKYLLLAQRNNISTVDN